MTTHSLTATGTGMTGVIGGYVTFPGVTSNILSTPHSAAYQVTKLTLIVRLRPTTWTPSTNKYIVARTSGGNTFRMSLLATTGAIYLGTYNSGGTETNRSSNAYIAASGVAAGDWLWIAASNDPDDGATHSVFRLYWSRDGATWTSFLTSSSAAATNIATATTPTLEIGATNGAQAWSGDIGYVAVRDGVGAAGVVGGTDVFRTDGAVDLAGVAPTANTYTAATGQTVTVGHSGGTPTVVVPVIGGAALAIVSPLTATGTGTSSGSAALAVSLPLTATGTGASAGSAAMLVGVVLTATGTGTSTGSAAFALSMPFTATGAGASTGTATLIQTATLTATGTGQSAGTGALVWEATLTATGIGASSGSATFGGSTPLTAAGTGTSAGSATLGLETPLTATGTGQSAGTVAIAASMPMSATGADTSSGSAVLVPSIPLSATGADTSAGIAALILARVLAATGVGTSAGTATLIATLTLAAYGIGASSGIATPQMSMTMSATGTGQSAGTAVFYVPTAGGTSTGTVTTNRSTGSTTTNTSTGAITVNGSTGTILPMEASYV